MNAEKGSPIMKRIRILTGCHAGASLDLSPGKYSLGLGHDSDVSITDWTHPPLDLVVDDLGNVLAQWRGERHGADTEPAAKAAADGHKPAFQSHAFVDFEPRAFADTVLCTGPADQDWPPDCQLLEAAFPATPQRMARWASGQLRRRAASVAAGLGVLMLCALGTIGLMESPQAAWPPETVQATADRVKTAVDKLGIAGVQVTAAAGKVVLSGRVENAEQATKVREAAKALNPAYAVKHTFSVASEVAESIRSGVGVPGAEVKHLGDGVFAFTAEAADVQAARQALDRVVGDLGPAVRRIELKLEQTARNTPEVPILSSMSDDTVSVVQTRDGAKHLVVSTIDPLVAARQALGMSAAAAQPITP